MKRKLPLIATLAGALFLPVPGRAASERPGIYPTPEHEARIMALYEGKLARWGVPYEQRDVPTRFGRTHLIVSGPEGAPAVLLIHAMGVTATMWQPTVAALSQRYRVYAIDTIGDLGKSQLAELENYPKDGHGYRLWLDDVMDALQLDKASIVAASMGGWISINLASERPERVERLVLLAPMGINAAWEVLLRLSWLVMFPTKGNKEGLTKWVLGDNPAVNEALGPYMNTAMDCRMKLGTPGDLPEVTLHKLTMPTLIMFGGVDHPIGDATKAANRARQHVPHATVEVMPNAGHMLNMEAPEIVNERILGFLP